MLLTLFVAAAIHCDWWPVQTWTSGMTLPRRDFLEHQPQYIPPSPPFPLPRELATQEAVPAQPTPEAASDPNERAEQLLKQSEDLRQIREERERLGLDQQSEFERKQRVDRQVREELERLWLSDLPARLKGLRGGS
jgi:hypothetical protein